MVYRLWVERPWTGLLWVYCLLAYPLLAVPCRIGLAERWGLSLLASWFPRLLSFLRLLALPLFRRFELRKVFLQRFRKF